MTDNRNIQELGEKPSMGFWGYSALILGAMCVASSISVDAHIAIRGLLMLIGNGLIYAIGLAKGYNHGQLVILENLHRYFQVRNKLADSLDKEQEDTPTASARSNGA